MIDDLYKFIKDCLNNNPFSLTKRDIIIYNFFVEVILEFKKLYFLYEKDIDIDLNSKNSLNNYNFVPTL